MNARTSTFIQLTGGYVDRPIGSVEAQADTLLMGCLQEPERFPVRLFVLGIGPEFLPNVQQLLTALDHRRRELKLDAPLIGSTITACVYQNEIRQGAMLVALQSPLIRAWAGYVPFDRAAPPAKAVTALLRELGLELGSVKPLHDRSLLTFLPGYDATGDPTSYRAAELVRELGTQTRGTLPTCGGVSSAHQGEPGLQFLNDRALSDCVIGAVVETQLKVGVAMAPVVIAGVERFRADGNGRVIDDPGPECYGPVAEGEPLILGLIQPGEEVAMVTPVRREGKLHFQQDVQEGQWIQRLRHNQEYAQRSLKDQRDHLESIFRIHHPHLAGVLGFNCAARLRYQNEIGWNLPQALKKLRERYPEAPYYGCFLDGEVGIDMLGRSRFGGWSVSEFMVSDEIAEGALGHLALHAVGRCAEEAACARSVNEAMHLALNAIVESVGLPGGMVSIVTPDKDEWHVIAQEAIGPGWLRIKMMTRRSLKSDDILARVCNGEHVCYFEPDAQRPGGVSHAQTAEAGGIRSFATVRLEDDRGNAIGVLQLDLGDMSTLTSLGPETWRAFQTLGRTVAEMITRACQREQLALARAMDEVVKYCIENNLNSQDSTTRLVTSLVETMNKGAAPADVPVLGALVRTPDRTNAFLQVAGGVGAYYQAIVDLNVPLSLAEKAPACEAYLKTDPVQVWNDTSTQELFRLYNVRFRTMRLGDEHSKILSCAIFHLASGPEECEQPEEPVRPSGLLIVYSQHAWYFTGHRLESLKAVAARIGQLRSQMTHFAQRRQGAEFLQAIRPRQRERFNLWKRLRDHAETARQVAGADALSFYLWEEDRGRYVLRAEAGWAFPTWINAAWLPAESVCTLPEYTEDIRQARPDSAGRRYLESILSPVLEPGKTCEVLLLPLWVNEERVGAVVLHKRRPIEAAVVTSCLFCDPDVLFDICASLSSACYACQQKEEQEWLAQEKDRQHRVSLALLNSRYLSVNDICRLYCRTVQEVYGFSVAVYHPINDGSALDVTAQAIMPGRSPFALISDTDDAALRAYLEESCNYIEERNRTASDPSNVKLVALEEVAQRVCVGIKLEPLGFVLDLRWHQRKPLDDLRPPPLHDGDELRHLAGLLEMALQASRVLGPIIDSQARLAGIAHALVGVVHETRSSVSNAHRICSNLLETEGLDLEIQQKLGQINRMLGGVEPHLWRAFEAGQSGIREQKQETDLGVLLREAIKPYSTSINIQEEIQNGATTFCIPELVKHAFALLISNAIKAFDRLPFTHPRRLCLTVRLQIQQHQILITIDDNGPGFDILTLERLKQGLPAHEDRISGTGIATLVLKGNGAKSVQFGNLEQGATVIIPFALRNGVGQ